jgi:hypothetical protein
MIARAHAVMAANEAAQAVYEALGGVDKRVSWIAENDVIVDGGQPANLASFASTLVNAPAEALYIWSKGRGWQRPDRDWRELPAAIRIAFEVFQFTLARVEVEMEAEALLKAAFSPPRPLPNDGLFERDDERLPGIFDRVDERRPSTGAVRPLAPRPADPQARSLTHLAVDPAGEKLLKRAARAQAPKDKRRK